MRALIYRCFLTCINIFFPPLAVMMLTGMGWDTMMNCCLFLLAVIPSHVHGFYISCTYFHRRHKVKKGRYPGGPKSFIESPNVINGGASAAEVDRLWRKENGLVEGKGSGRREGQGMKRSDSHRPEMAQRATSKQMTGRDDCRPDAMLSMEENSLRRAGTNRSNRIGRPSAPRSRTQEHIGRDGYGGVGGGYSPADGGPQSSPRSRRGLF